MYIDKMSRWAFLRRRVRTSREQAEFAKLERELAATAKTAWPAQPRYRQDPKSWQYRDHSFPGRMGRFGIKNH